jgi:hypothetical protein
MIKSETLSLMQQFQGLAESWRTGTQWFSSLDDIAAHPAYRQIIAMGRDVLPILLEEMRLRPDHWSMALHAITGENPVKDEHRGNVKLMAQDWVDWGKQRGFLS